MRTVGLPSGETVAALGQGTWRMGEDKSAAKDEVAALRHGIDLGMNLIDTAEMYGDGGSERIVGEAIRGQRDRVYLVSKVLPQNAGGKHLRKACEASLKYLGTDHLDLYLLHWRGSVPLAETIDGFFALQDAGKIRHFGVSNFDTDDMDELWETPGGDACQTNQILYNLSRRWPEATLHDWCQRNRQPLMIYSPLEQGRLSEGGALGRIAKTHGATPIQIALAWTLRHSDMFVVPKASRVAHVEENRAALDIALTNEDLATLNEAYPPPSGDAPLEIL
jgi:diketogulonate reductase-like aldo/keto reductase